MLPPGGAVVNGLRLCTVLRVVAEVRAEYPLQGDACDRIARGVISEATPVHLRSLLDAHRQAYREMCERELRDAVRVDEQEARR